MAEQHGPSHDCDCDEDHGYIVGDAFDSSGELVASWRECKGCGGRVYPSCWLPVTSIRVPTHSPQHIPDIE